MQHLRRGALEAAENDLACGLVDVALLAHLLKRDARVLDEAVVDLLAVDCDTAHVYALGTRCYDVV